VAFALTLAPYDLSVMIPASKPVTIDPNHPKQHLPHFTGTLAMIWFISGLGMLFGAGLIGYIMIRMNRADTIGIGSLHLPQMLWLSTALVIVASVTIQLAVTSIRREQQDRLRAWLVVTLLVGLAFVVIQVPSLASLIHQHQVELAKYDAAGGRAAGAISNPLFGLIFVYIVIHAAHVLGGIIQLIFVTRGAFLGKYDHEYFNPVKHAAMYWHFLDVVWLIMFGLMVGAG
jgi:cytochrome c oxidase subunit III